ncbi:hypothetical protein A2V71_01575 [Candidatus Berkelbacteria bacterium RBG_13_40_8]|uniref:ABC transporter domain-containing protein n=1 Tax=Candidatus Berkelbacteria bacterium RBG_13_40_8 TaxID=1797467 RepID=A0A1F5DP18_9BACT|nr:MAG: hypothetical protein A2V71_01575 [Candidatus Berkelbacteria bacterium RBG_13_40_8]
MEKVIEVKNLKKIFNHSTVAVDDISFDVFENQIFGLIGPNGSGKTTTQRILTTLLQPTAGEIKYHNRILTPKYANDIRNQIGYVPQGECLYEDLTVLENLYIFSKPYSISKEKRQKNIEALLQKLEIEERKNTLVKHLSGGLKKRASIATALVHEPKILFLDEVTMGLDPNARYHIWNLIKNLKKNTTIVLTTHYMDEAEDLCDKIAILSKGRILELASPKTVIEKYKVKNLNQVIGKIIEEEK